MPALGTWLGGLPGLQRGTLTPPSFLTDGRAVVQSQLFFRPDCVAGQFR
jgi:hypothetical protein